MAYPQCPGRFAGTREGSRRNLPHADETNHRELPEAQNRERLWGVASGCNQRGRGKLPPPGLVGNGGMGLGRFEKGYSWSLIGPDVESITNGKRVSPKIPRAHGTIADTGANILACAGRRRAAEQMKRRDRFPHAMIIGVTQFWIGEQAMHVLFR